jgi:hypothetical protein
LAPSSEYSRPAGGATGVFAVGLSEALLEAMNVPAENLPRPSNAAGSGAGFPTLPSSVSFSRVTTLYPARQAAVASCLIEGQIERMQYAVSCLMRGEFTDEAMARL